MTVTVESTPPEQGGAFVWTADQLRLQVHRLLQNVQDTLPDDVVVAARRSLATGDAADAAEVVAFAVRQAMVPLSDLELTVLEECLEALGRDPATVAPVAVDDGARPLLYTFEAGENPSSVDDEGVVARLAGAPGLVGVWRAWRRPATSTPWPPARACYVVETGDQAALDEVMRRCYGPDVPEPAAGEPLVDAYVTGQELPDLVRVAQLSGSVVHLGVPVPEFEFADLFDGEPGDDGLPQELVRLPDDEAQRLLTYLEAGRIVLLVEEPASDLLDPATTMEVHLRTDGRWVWTDGAAHYLRAHRIAPPREFLEYLRSRDAVPPLPDVVLHLIIAWLREDDPSRPLTLDGS